MSSLTDKFSKNFSPGKKKEFERRVSEMAGNMSEMAAIQLVLAEMFQEGKKDGGMIDKSLGSGGVKLVKLIMIYVEKEKNYLKV